MYIPSPTMTPVVSTENLDDLFDAFSVAGNVQGGVAVFGNAASYALVWELGSRRMKNPGPKTTWGLNRNGERVILSKQAPRGYIGINQSKFWQAIKANLEKINFTPSDTQATIKLKLSVAVDNASQQIAQIIAADAPVDSGDLRAGIQMLDDSDSVVASAWESDTVLVI